MTEILFNLPDGLLDSVAERVAARLRHELVDSSNGDSPWLNVDSAAAYLDSTPDAIRAAEKRGQLRGNRSGTGRLLFARQDLDAFARGEVA